MKTLNRPSPLFRPVQRGYALLTSILFLVLLTIVALTALKSSGLEARMGANNALHAQAFESSESTRRLLDSLIDANVFNRGWPAQIGGKVDNALFLAADLALLTSKSTTPPTCPLSSTDITTYKGSGFVICKDTSTNYPRDWWSGNSETAAFATFFPAKLDRDGWYSSALASGDTKHYIAGDAYVYNLYTTLAPGSGSQQAAGYLGLGRSAAAGGGYIFFYMNGSGDDFGSTPQAGAETSAIFRDVIRN